MRQQGDKPSFDKEGVKKEATTMAPKDEATNRIDHDGGEDHEEEVTSLLQVQQHELYGKDPRHGKTTEAQEHASTPPNNKKVLSVAFYSFVFFCILEGIFALLANSQSMLADAMAMSIDALTYLFNLAAEHYKNQPLPERLRDHCMAEQEHYKQLRRLYLELVPPTISVAVLFAITISTCQEALHSLFGHDDDKDGDNEEESVSVKFGKAAVSGRVAPTELTASSLTPRALACRAETVCTTGAAILCVCSAGLLFGCCMDGLWPAPMHATSANKCYRDAPSNTICGQRGLH